MIHISKGINIMWFIPCSGYCLHKNALSSQSKAQKPGIYIISSLKKTWFLQFHSGKIQNRWIMHFFLILFLNKGSGISSWGYSARCQCKWSWVVASSPINLDWRCWNQLDKQYEQQQQQQQQQQQWFHWQCNYQFSEHYNHIQWVGDNS